MKKIMFLCALFCASMTMFAETETLTWAANSGTALIGEGAESGYQYATTNFLITQKKYQNTNNNVVNTYAQMRCYKGHSLTIEANSALVASIDKITFTMSGTSYSMSNSSVVSVIPAEATAALNEDEEAYTLTGNATSLTLTFGAQVRITAIEISYTKAATSEPIITAVATVDFGTAISATGLDEKTLSIAGENLTALTYDFKETTDAFTVTGDLTATGGDLKINCVATTAGTHTATLVLTGTPAVTKEITLTATILDVEGDGTKENPFTVADVITMAGTYEGSFWVEGYILGSLKTDGSEILAQESAQATNLALGATAEATIDNCISVQLSSGNARTTLNVSDNPANVGKQVKVYGSLETYLNLNGVKGVKDADDFVLEGAPIPEEKGAISIADFLEVKDDFNIYTLTGTVSNIVSTQYGNFDLTDETGTIYIYGLLNADGQSGQFESLGIQEGDLLTLKGSYSEYKGDPQIASAIYVGHTVTGLEKVEATNRIFAIDGKINAPKDARIFNLIGMDVTHMNGQLSNGIFLVKTGKNVTKVLVKK